MHQDPPLWRLDRNSANERRLAFVPEPCTWLADEIAIDFPSVQSIVDRMRLGLLGEDPPSSVFFRDIELSPREAWDGVSLTLVVPIKTTCLLCGGRGESWAETCRSCEGSGIALRSQDVRLSFPARVSNGARFQFCLMTPQAPPTRVEVRVAIR